MDIEKLVNLPRPVRLRVVAAAAQRYIGRAACREDAASATENILIVLLRMFLGDAARRDLPVPAQGGLRSQISRATERFAELLEEEINKASRAPCLARTKTFSEMSAVKRAAIAPRGYQALHRRLLEIPQYSGVAALLLAGIELVLARAIARTGFQRQAEKIRRQFRKTILRRP